MHSMDVDTPLSAVILCDRHAADEYAAEPWPLRAEGRTALDYLSALIASQVDDRVLVTRDPLAVFGWDGLIAAPPGAAPSLLTALHTGLKLARHPQALVLALDAPWVQEGVVTLLRAAFSPRWDAVLPQVADCLRPFPAVYARSSLQRIDLHLQRGVPGIQALLARLRCRPISEKKLRPADPALKSFTALEAAP